MATSRGLSITTGKTYRLFISHAWAYGGGYDRLVGLLNAASRFRWRNYSAPSSKPVVDMRTTLGKRKLRAELADQIRPVGCVVILAGMYVPYKEWIRAEIDIAVAWEKPILGVRPWGALRTPVAVSNVADEMVSWSTTSIVSAIRRLHG
jgi:MTH538 TIR-like domain (DUF1863)